MPWERDHYGVLEVYLFEGDEITRPVGNNLSVTIKAPPESTALHVTDMFGVKHTIEGAYGINTIDGIVLFSRQEKAVVPL